jgi:hypoxanthine phosphoribosyltransferase
MTPKPLFPEDVIRRRVAELAGRISSDYAGREVLLVGVLKGAFIFLADLSRRLTIPRRVDFIAVASYGDGTTPSVAVRLVLDLRADIAGKDVIIVEDIVDTGGTLAYLQDMLKARRPRSLRTCAFLRKVKDREREPEVDYLGFEIEDDWVVGYGLDYADEYRTLPYIGVIEPPAP